MAIQPEESPAWSQWQKWHQASLASSQWTDGDYAIDRVAWLDAVVRNSGWIEVLASSMDYLDDVIETLRAIGAVETLNILKQCTDRFPDGRPSNDPHERGEQIRSLSCEDRRCIDSLDEEYYASKEDICGMAVNYWQSTRT